MVARTFWQDKQFLLLPDRPLWRSEILVGTRMKFHLRAHCDDFELVKQKHGNVFYPKQCSNVSQVHRQSLSPNKLKIISYMKRFLMGLIDQNVSYHQFNFHKINFLSKLFYKHIEYTVWTMLKDVGFFIK